ncbi:hypothetical protein PHYBLDRAFT_158622 [Phycomyces blakesleeanus NRRL 1555(-)]|uniref:Uncharacterized protein n=1 Tax=Phycomyces blakesleeanus (strain ATCC 8743b / DSM 1359 / FGSC 10004 / NBRC 33097 / NRRL 1555) TaxID=763407 RepID=A0A162PLX5_PHYB8|nr:hypothetical protein PHYBLDRAFT_158622 [Phycomyces blakesleeanus NRRL 1555(-)]OAD74107.1 hypothetical protein PHYBLDRAFT_158622 [Phycomyces blakesleeanus NRRL 1555(-)]|eukprot:XP_018292147.1 hypothetical protein PHYBLDRAFT_158622 [Phycomyces blakesleeanus NRRL 1555(-)]
MTICFKSKLHNVKDVPQDTRTPIGKCDKGVTKTEDRTVVNPGDFNYEGTKAFQLLHRVKQGL